MRGFWTYQAPEPPSVEQAIRIGAVRSDTTEAEWCKLSPGMRREVCRSVRTRQGDLFARHENKC